MKNRSREDLIATMLRIAKNGESRSHLMYSTFISHRQLMEYLAYMQRCKLIRVESKSHHIYTTDKGMTWLDAYETLMSITDEDMNQTKGDKK